jgi:hypothetical protein
MAGARVCPTVVAPEARVTEPRCNAVASSSVPSSPAGATAYLSGLVASATAELPTGPSTRAAMAEFPNVSPASSP